MSDNIKQRDFVRQISKYLKDTGTFIVCGKKKYRVHIEELSDIEDIKQQLSDKIRVKAISETTIPTPNDIGFVPNYLRDTTTYGCGCEKKSDYLCSRHGRA